MSGYEFADRRCWRIWQAAKPKGDRHLAAFAWRESPASLERAWAKLANGKEDEALDRMLAQILTAADQQTAYRQSRINAGERLHRPRGIAVWLNAGGWAEEIGQPAGSPAREAPTKSCKHCSDPIVHAPYGTCARHTPIPEGQAWIETLVRSRMRELESWREEAQRPDETSVQFYVRAARVNWRKMVKKGHR